MLTPFQLHRLTFIDRLLAKMEAARERLTAERNELERVATEKETSKATGQGGVSG